VTRWSLLKQVTSQERARRRRELVRQRCRRYGWEPFSVDETPPATTSVDDANSSEHDTDSLSSDTPACTYSTLCLPTIPISIILPMTRGSDRAMGTLCVFVWRITFERTWIFRMVLILTSIWSTLPYLGHCHRSRSQLNVHRSKVFLFRLKVKLNFGKPGNVAKSRLELEIASK